MTDTPSSLHLGPDVGPDDARPALAAALPVGRWVDSVAAHAPFPSMVHLLDAAAAAGDGLTPAEVDEALVGHPRLRSTGTGGPVAEELERACATYEERFGRVFLVRTAGRSGEEILAELHRRLGLDPDTEAAHVAEQLRENALVRLGQMWEEPGSPAALARQEARAEQPRSPTDHGPCALTTRVLDTALGTPGVGVPVRLDERTTEVDGTAAWRPLGRTVTGDDGTAVLGPERLDAGVYRLTLDTDTYFAATGRTSGYPEVTVTFRVDDATSRYDVPVLLAPFGYSTHRAF
ncbi:hydroxyisourate hydrolase [Sanguibacter suaedae]|uniref:Hydroxyisourate hydrolase n=1 Tax=Sanguibacter suaedae TaxID=2795737 RepID=A0A934IDD1_9MICO|nr:hydroxyisourate hydrolase [Sanguibacter suaedae]MBI9115680.1 hydroxyisourate hydrolase [Sanguibacter suaedae]